MPESKLLAAQLSLDLKELDSPEELNPLKDALDRAKRRVDQSTGIREALEAEVSIGDTATSIVHDCHLVEPEA